jgi:hypothetical protein
METAGKTGSPKASAAAPKKSSVGDIINHITKYGTASAAKKFGKAEMNKAVAEVTNQMEQTG